MSWRMGSVGILVAACTGAGEAPDRVSGAETVAWVRDRVAREVACPESLPALCMAARAESPEALPDTTTTRLGVQISVRRSRVLVDGARESAGPVRLDLGPEGLRIQSMRPGVGPSIVGGREAFAGLLAGLEAAAPVTIHPSIGAWLEEPPDAWWTPALEDGAWEYAHHEDHVARVLRAAPVGAQAASWVVIEAFGEGALVAVFPDLDVVIEEVL